MKTLRLALVASIASAAALAAAQETGEVFFKSTIGSFKCLAVAGVPVKGKLVLKLRGTILVSRPTPETKIETSGSIRMEHDYAKYGKRVYFGNGTVTIDGKFESIQVFGKEIDGHFVGKGFFRLYGEFDKNLETGEWWYAGGEHKPWGTGGMQVSVPEPSMAAPEIKINPAKGSKGGKG